MIFCIISLFINKYEVSAQSGDALPVKAVYDINQNKVYLRWAPKNQEDWFKSLESGFTIRRKRVLDASGNMVNDTVFQLGEVHVYSPQEWMTFQGSPLDTLALVAKNLVNQDSLDEYLSIPDSSQIKLADALIYNQAKNDFFTYSILMADQNFDIAKGLGLAFVDSLNFQQGHTYAYAIRLNSLDSIQLRGEIMIQISSANGLTPPSKPFATGGNKKAEISWSTAATDKQYSYYDIFRSDDNGSTFQKVNAFPFIQMTDINLPDDTLSTYTDTIPQNGVTYIYKVRGISPFGIEAPFSDTVHVKGIPPLLNLNVKLDSIIVTENITISWTLERIFADRPSDSLNITGFNIYEREKPDDASVKINSSLLPLGDRNYTFAPNFATAYYMVEALDANNRSYISISVLGQSIDSIPPDAPQNLTGEVGQNGTVSLQWDPNNEADLHGYKVFFSNDIDGDFAQITKDVVKDTNFITFTDLSFGIDKIFYYICAVDKRYNISARSNIAILNRPDKIAPANPLLSHVLPREEGMRIAWKLSHSEDITFHYLQRKLKNSTTWQTVIQIRAESQFPPMNQMDFEMVPSNYIDTTQLTMTQYQYRLIAVDSSGNVGASEVITVKPYDDGIRGEIVYLQGTFYDLSSPNAAILHPDLNIIPTLPNGNSNFIGKDAAILKWRYNTNFPSTHRDFKIYFRYVDPQNGGGSGGAGGSGGGSGGGSSSTHDAHGDLSDFKLIKTITAYQAHKMADAIEYNGFAFAHEIARKDNTNLNLEYKIIATHSDGGFSMPEVIVVQGF